MTRPLRPLNDAELWYIRKWSRECGADAIVEAATNIPRRKRGRPKQLRTIENSQIVQIVELGAEEHRRAGSKAPITDALRDCLAGYKDDGSGISFAGLKRRYYRGKAELRMLRLKTKKSK